MDIYTWKTYVSIQFVWNIARDFTWFTDWWLMYKNFGHNNTWKMWLDQVLITHPRLMQGHFGCCMQGQLAMHPCGKFPAPFPSPPIPPDPLAPFSGGSPHRQALLQAKIPLAKSLTTLWIESPTPSISSRYLAIVSLLISFFSLSWMGLLSASVSLSSINVGIWVAMHC